MTPYQRGYRDGLLSFAKHLEALATEEKSTMIGYHKQMDVNRDPNYAAALAYLELASFRRLEVLKECHRLALAAAEALPDDPEAM